MFPIPDPGRLFPPKLPPSRGSGPGFSSLADGLLSIGSYGIFLVIAFGGSAFAYSFSPWFLIIGVPLSFGLGMAIIEAPPIFLGIIDAIFYFCITFIFSGGFDRPDPNLSWIYSGVVAAVFFWATFLVWKGR